MINKMNNQICVLLIVDLNVLRPWIFQTIQNQFRSESDPTYQTKQSNYLGFYGYPETMFSLYFLYSGVTPFIQRCSLSDSILETNIIFIILYFSNYLIKLHLILSNKSGNNFQVNKFILSYLSKYIDICPEFTSTHLRSLLVHYPKNIRHFMMSFLSGL